jgi:hypothetical protein
MSRTPKNDRARRNALKAGGLILGSLLVAVTPFKQASALGDFPPRNPPPGQNPPPGPTPGQNPSPGGGGSCFARGTLIRTRDGYRPIESLAAGNEVAVRFGGFAPIKAVISHTLNSMSGKWVGESNFPVLIRRGALGENAPASDLCLTALHAVYVEGYLMNVGDLVNGTSIIFEAANG